MCTSAKKCLFLASAAPRPDALFDLDTQITISNKAIVFERLSVSPNPIIILVASCAYTCYYLKKNIFIMLYLNFVKLFNVSFVNNNLLDNYFYNFTHKSVTEPFPSQFQINTCGRLICTNMTKMLNTWSLSLLLFYITWTTALDKKVRYKMFCLISN
jgi:hypothetical protein